MDEHLKGIEEKIVLVTGGAKGLGFAYATELLRNGAAYVAILDLANSNGEEAACKLNKDFGQGRAIFIVCDVTKPQEFEAGFAKTVEKFGALDIVINNAGIKDNLPWELMVNFNYNAVVRGVLLGLQFVGQDMGGPGGAVVNICSIVGVIPASPFSVYYSGTKHAVIRLSQNYARSHHYRESRVRMITMCLSITDTQLISQRTGQTLDLVSPSRTISTALEQLSTQTADNVAQGLVHILRVAENDSVWVVKKVEPIYEIKVPHYPARSAE